MPKKPSGHLAAKRPADLTAAAVLMARLRAVGVDYVFANSGTDFPPIIEGIAAAAEAGLDLPQALVMPHESAAMGMAHGYYFATGRPQAVMAHTNVGLANCAIGALNAATDNVPLLLFSGRTPTTEADRFGARTVPIGWGQEMRDQTALVREAVKWDYELRFPEQAAGLIDRANAIATSTPRGPVYISLPREVLCEAGRPCDIDGPATMAPARSVPPAEDIEAAARMIAGARAPMIIAQRGAGSAEAFSALSRLAEDWAIPVSHYWATQIAVPTRHPMCIGSAIMPWLGEADLVLALDALAPWWPDRHGLAPGAKVIQAGPNPLFSRTPIRNFPSSLSLAGETADIVLALADALGRPNGKAAKTVAARRDVNAKRVHQARADAAASDDLSGAEMTKAWVSRCLSDVLAEAPGGAAGAVLSELGAPLDPLDLSGHGTWYQEPHSGGLGWSFPCALGLQLADRGRLVVATMGDGSYMFANPVACHQIAEALELPVLILVLNNREWGAVRQSVAGLYPDGHAARANRMPLTSLAPTPDFTRVAEASRAWAARVTAPGELAATLRDALRHIAAERSHALVEIAVKP